MSPAAAPSPAFSHQVRARFARQAHHYGEQARLQQGVAWRLAHLCRALPLPAGLRADLGAGSGLVGQALQQLGDHQPLLQLDLCPELLAHNPLATPSSQVVWDLNRPLPEQLRQAALLTSSFALQWLDDPARQLQHWCGQLRPGGWLALAVPTSGSFPQWHRAAAAAGVPCTALPLPNAEALLAATAQGGLHLRHCRRLQFSRGYGSGLGFLQQLKTLGAGTSRSDRLSRAQLRRLIDNWPCDGCVSWEVLLLLGQRPTPTPSPVPTP
ncbi:MAG: methyltransferase domain-containing protein [Cyanobacteria bacterium M_DeepCast_100m_m1_067]|nr:methyltransferase domain-containing protein [Cyanobacteria bacterium M_DeepCast_100m_m1_067]